MNIKGNRSVDSIHKELGKIMWEYVGMARTKKGLETAIEKIKALREEFWKNLKIPGKTDTINPELEKANRLADFIEIGDLMARDALQREESCGGHFNEAFQTEAHEARRDDENFCHVAAWEFTGDIDRPQLHKEPLVFENVELTQRSYK